MSEDNGKGSRSSDCEEASLTLLSYKVEELSKSVGHRNDKQDELNAKIVETMHLLSGKVMVQDQAIQNQDKNVDELKKSNSIHTKLLYLIASACISTFVALIVQALKH